MKPYVRGSKAQHKVVRLQLFNVNCIIAAFLFVLAEVTGGETE